MNEITVFENNQFGEIRTLNIDGEPWFVATDVCRALEIGDTQSALRRLDDDEKGKDSIRTLGGNQELLIVSESGLYSLVLGSRKPEAKVFKRWITHEVIPAIRKTGVYSVKPLSQAEMLLEQAKLMVRQEQRMSAMEIKQSETEKRIDALETKLNPTLGMDWYTITGYISLKKYRVNPNDYAMLGKQASSLSREKGYPIGSAPHPSYGKVGVYSSDILAEVFDRYGDKW